MFENLTFKLNGRATKGGGKMCYFDRDCKEYINICDKHKSGMICYQPLKWGQNGWNGGLMRMSVSAKVDISAAEMIG